MEQNVNQPKLLSARVKRRVSNRPAISKKAVLLDTLGGALAGYMVIHPITMVIYLLCYRADQGSVEATFMDVLKRVFVSFDSSMLPAGIFFALLGAGLGCLAGIYTSRIAAQEFVLRKYEQELYRNIMTLIQNGETATTEFKSSLRWDSALGKVNKELEKTAVRTLAGFLNASGGTLLIGVTDTGEISSVEQDYATLKRKDRDGFERHVVTLISTMLGADVCGLCHVLFHEVQGKDVCRIYVQPSFRPVYFQEGHDKHYYVRAENSTREMDVEEATRYITWKWAYPR